MSIDHVGSGSGIGAADRAHTIKKIIDPGSRPSDFVQPGHVFPLRARPGGVLERRGHTEAAVDLCRLAGLAPAAVICEVLHDDGSPARLPFLELFAQEHRVAIISVAQIADHRAALGESVRLTRPPPALDHREDARPVASWVRRASAVGQSPGASPISRSAAAIAARSRRAVAGRQVGHDTTRGLAPLLERDAHPRLTVGRGARIVVQADHPRDRRELVVCGVVVE